MSCGKNLEMSFRSEILSLSVISTYVLKTIWHYGADLPHRLTPYGAFYCFIVYYFRVIDLWWAHSKQRYGLA